MIVPISREQKVAKLSGTFIGAIIETPSIVIVFKS